MCALICHSSNCSLTLIRKTLQPFSLQIIYLL